MYILEGKKKVWRGRHARRNGKIIRSKLILNSDIWVKLNNLPDRVIKFSYEAFLGVADCLTRRIANSAIELLELFSHAEPKVLAGFFPILSLLY